MHGKSCHSGARCLGETRKLQETAEEALRVDGEVWRGLRLGSIHVGLLGR